MVVLNIFVSESYIWSNDLSYFFHLEKSQENLVFSVYAKFLI